jgi:hypothetical protein
VQLTLFAIELITQLQKRKANKKLIEILANTATPSPPLSTFHCMVVLALMARGTIIFRFLQNKIIFIAGFELARYVVCTQRKVLKL